MRNELILTAAFLVLSAGAVAAAPVGVTVQGYPAGVIAEAEVELPLEAHHSLFLRAGYNFTDRKDYGEHDNEEGGGPGVTVGYRYTLHDSGDGWFFGGRADVWFLAIDWKDRGRSGSTDVVVFQPTAEAGYRARLKNGWAISPFLALGAEINVRTSGEDVGQGAIFLAGLTLTKSF
ncbi:MAG: autotransporter domain-containing protein [Acidobacteria bacterium]|nr:autotransporter domain-containing protein [Acidobacteriota bacterium]